MNEPEFLLLYNPKINKYYLVSGDLSVPLDNDLTPMDKEFFPVIMKPAMERIRFERERDKK